MSKTQDLAHDIDERLQLAEAVQDGDSSLDDLFDRAMARGGFTNKSLEEVMSDISKTPLFMTDLADAGDDKEANDMLEALKALQYEGTKAEIAQNFKDSGNECVASRQWKDAKEHYSKGIAVLTDKSDGKWDKPDDMDQELADRIKILEALYTNRARCNLELKNYRSTSLDCAAALNINPKNVKAHYRSALALFSLDKVYEALDVCYRGVKLDADNAPMQTLLEKIQKRSRVKEEQDKKRKAEQEYQKKVRLLLATALKARNIKVSGSRNPPNMADAEIRLMPDPLSPQSSLEFPLMLLYPLHNESDFIRAFNEKDALADHLAYILPLPWDSKGEYQLAGVDCFMDTMTGGLMKVGKQLSLLEVLSGDNVGVIDGLVRIYVVPRASTSSWIAEMKKQKGK